jgi:hypothetical protein
MAYTIMKRAALIEQIEDTRTVIEKLLTLLQSAPLNPTDSFPTSTSDRRRKFRRASKAVLRKGQGLFESAYCPRRSWSQSPLGNEDKPAAVNPSPGSSVTAASIHNTKGFIRNNASSCVAPSHLVSERTSAKHLTGQPNSPTWMVKTLSALDPYR